MKYHKKKCNLLVAALLQKGKIDQTISFSPHPRFQIPVAWTLIAA